MHELTLDTLLRVSLKQSLKHELEKRLCTASPLGSPEGSLGNEKELRTNWKKELHEFLLSTEGLSTFAELFWERNEKHLPFQVGGVEAMGIPLIAAIVMKGAERGTLVNGFYIRKSRKREGLMKFVEGTLTEDPVILVDDYVDTGRSIERQLLTLRDLRVRTLRVCALFSTRSPEGYGFVRTHKVEFETFFDISDLGIPQLPHPAAPLNPPTVLWQHHAPNPSFELVVHKSSPALVDNRIFIGSDAGTFFALNAQTGAVLWTFETGRHPLGKGILSSPIVYRDTVFFGAYDGDVYALDTRTGTLKWRYRDADWIGSSPALAPDRGLVFIGLEFGLMGKRGGIAALDMHTGKCCWQDFSPALTHASPCYIPELDIVVCGSNNGIVYAHNAQTGARLWQYQTGGDIKMAPAYDREYNLILVASMDSNVYALTPKGELRFLIQTKGGLYCTPLIHEGHCYVGSLDKKVYAISLANGKAVGTYATRGRIFSSASYGLSSLWIGSNDGALYELEPKTLALKQYYQASERFVGKPCVDEVHRRIYAVTVANTLYCLQKPDSTLRS